MGKGDGVDGKSDGVTPNLGRDTKFCDSEGWKLTYEIENTYRDYEEKLGVVGENFVWKKDY